MFGIRLDYGRELVFIGKYIFIYLWLLTTVEKT